MNDPRQIIGPTALAPVRGAGPPGPGAPGPDCYEAQLLRQIARGDQGAMAEFYRLHGSTGCTAGLCSRRSSSSSVSVPSARRSSRTLCSPSGAAGSFRGESRVRSWVIAIARRQARDRLRRHRLRVVDDGFLAGQPRPGPGPELMALERAEVA